MANEDKPQQLARIEAIEAGTADGDTLASAWRGAKTFQLNLRTRLRRAVAGSPSLPPSIAAEVIVACPAALFANPALPLLLMEVPDLLARAPRAFWQAAFGAAEISPALMPALVAACPHRRMSALARRPEFEAADAPALLDRLLQTLFLGDSPRWSLSDADALRLCQQWHEPMLDLPAALVDTLRGMKDDLRAKALLARCVQVPPQEALALRTSGQYAIEQSLAARRDLAPEELHQIAVTQSGPARVAVAANPSCPVETLIRLLKDHHPDVAACALLNPSLPRIGYELLLKRGTARRRAFLAARPDLTADDYDLLSRAGELDVRLAVAQNPHAPAEVLARLAEDLLEEVRDAARDNPSYVFDPAAAQAVEMQTPKPAARGKKPKPTLLERARPLLLGNMSAGAKWEAVLAWVESGGARPKRATMSPQDRKRLVREGLTILGEDPTTYDDAQTRLLAGIVDAMGSLPELNGPLHRAARDGAEDAQRALAEAWMARLMAAGCTEAESLALLLDQRLVSQHGRDRGWSQSVIALRALAARADRIEALVKEVKHERAFEHFVSDAVHGLVRANLSAQDTQRALTALVAVPRARACLDPRQLAWIAQLSAR